MISQTETSHGSWKKRKHVHSIKWIFILQPLTCFNIPNCTKKLLCVFYFPENIGRSKFYVMS